MALKLFFITGIPWVFEVLAWIPTNYPDLVPNWAEHTSYLFKIGNLLNSLRGLIVFIMFVVLQRNVRRHLLLELSKRFPLCFSITQKECTRDFSQLRSSNQNTITNSAEVSFPTSTSEITSSTYTARNQAVA